MYQPQHHREDRVAIQHDLIRAHPLGLLITAGPGGLMANPVPFLIDSERGEYGTLRPCRMRQSAMARAWRN
jgi:transcriptional regulator